jgi:site-specific DNA-cytosine methylase
VRLKPIDVDLFAGGGGASVGVEAATGKPIDVAINHDPIALAVHKANHPNTRHRLVGNSVCPECAEAVVRANVPADRARRAA